MDKKNEDAIVVDVKVEKGTIYVKLLKSKLAEGVASGRINIEHLPWIVIDFPQGQIGPAPDKGQLAVVSDALTQIGSELTRIEGNFRDYVVNATTQIQGLPNSKTILDILTQLKAETRGVNLPPNLKETIDAAGAKVVEAIEKGQHKLEVLNGLNVSGAQAQLAGVIIPQLKNMATALTPFAGIITGNIMSMLPGTNFNLGNLLNVLPTQLKDELFKNMPKDVQATLNSYLALTQDYQVGNFGGAISGMRVNIDVFLPNVVNMLKGVATPDELIDKLQNIMSDTSLFGLDQLTSITSMIPSAFGDIKLNIGADGSINLDTSLLTSTLGDLTGQLTNLTSTLGSLTGAASSLLGSAGSLTSVASSLSGSITSIPAGLSGSIGGMESALSALSGVGGGSLLGAIPNVGVKMMALNTATASKVQGMLDKLKSGPAFNFQMTLGL